MRLEAAFRWKVAAFYSTPIFYPVWGTPPTSYVQLYTHKNTIVYIAFLILTALKWCKTYMLCARLITCSKTVGFQLFKRLIFQLLTEFTYFLFLLSVYTMPSRHRWPWPGSDYAVQHLRTAELQMGLLNKQSAICNEKAFNSTGFVKWIIFMSSV